MLVSVCVVAYNEEKVIVNLLNDIKSQDYPHDKIEVLLIDSMSSDGTRKIMEDFCKNTEGFRRIVVYENPKKSLAPGCNVALKHYEGDAIVRIDAHASIPKDFIQKNVAVLKSGESVSGGQRPNIIDEKTPWKETLLMAEQSMFGSSTASYRRSKKRSYVKSIFHGVYRREVYDKVGMYNEKLGRTEDNEMSYRIRKAGYRICYSPDIISYQHTRSSLKGMLKQKYGNGYWIALTLKVCPKCFSIFHFVPLAFVTAIIVTTVLAAAHIPVFSILMWSAYWTLAIIMTAMAVKGKKKCWQQLLLPFLFFSLHVSYGVGSLVGIIKLPFWKYKN